MESPPPPSQQQANDAQAARYVAETAILGLFAATEEGGGGSESDLSALEAVKIAAILSALSTAVILISFRHPRDRTRSLLLVRPDPEQFSESLLEDAQRAFSELARADLTDKQRAVLWATWAHSRVSEEVATAVNRGDIPHEFSDRNLTLKKVWISRSDGRVRPLHIKLHGKTVSADADFWRWPHSGQRLRWPGDREAPPDATIGCRCVNLLTWAAQDAVSETIRRITENTAPSG